MASLKALCLAGVASLAATATTYAADLLPPPPPPVYYPPPPIVVGSGWYLRGDLGAGLTQLSNARSEFTRPIPDFSQEGSFLKETAIVGAGAGYQVNNWFRADVTGEYRFGAKYRAFENYTGSPNCPTGSGYFCVDGYKGTVSSAVFLANGYVQLGTWYGITPYVGGGVGVALNTMSGLVDYGITNSGAFGQAANKTTSNFAWALMAGLSYDLTPNVKLDIGYRYLDMGKLVTGSIECNVNNGCPHEVQRFNLTSHDLRIGLRYMFADYAPPPPPLIRKY